MKPYHFVFSTLLKNPKAVFWNMIAAVSSWSLAGANWSLTGFPANMFQNSS